MLAGALRTKDPLPSRLPDAKKARNQLCNIFQNHPAGIWIHHTQLTNLILIVQQNLINKTKFDLIFYYSYALALKEIICELEKLEITIKSIVGESDYTKELFINVIDPITDDVHKTKKM